jgi:uncharacterized protein
MKSDTIQFGSFAVPLKEFATQGNAILGIRDSGKSYTATFLAEKLLDYGIPFVAFDPIGVWRCLKVPGSPGLTGYNVVVAGEDADLRLTPASAPSIVKAAMQENISLVLDLYSMELSKRDWKAIVESCVRLLLYENKPHGLRHIFLEEAAEFAPQRIGPDQGSVYAEIEKLARMGGNAGLGYTLINQRAEEINKAVLELCDCLFLHRQKGRNSLVALGKWLDVADAGNRKEVIRSLPMLGQGRCWIWSQGSIEPVQVQIPKKSSFHPDRRNPAPAVSKAAVDVSDFVQRLYHALELTAGQRPQNVPNKEQRNPKLAQLEAMLSKSSAENANLRRQLDAAHTKLAHAHVLLKKMAALGLECGSNSEGFRHAPVTIAKKPSHEPRTSEISLKSLHEPPAADRKRPKAERAILSVLARHDPQPRPKAAVAIEAGYAVSGGGYQNALSRLRAQGLVTGKNVLELTETGRSYVTVNGKDTLPVGAALSVYWQSHLPRAERTILRALTSAPRRAWTKTQLATHTEYAPSGGGFNNALSRLRTLLLIDGKSDLVASERLFDPDPGQGGK